MSGTLSNRIASARADQRGFSLPELLVATMIALLVSAAGVGFIAIALRSGPPVSDRAAQIQQGRVLIERISRELRQGESIAIPTASGFSVLTYVDSATCGGAPAGAAIICRVTYACTATACTRTERNPNGSGSAPSETAVSGILGPNVFSYQPSGVDPAYVGVRLSFPARDGEETVTLDDGVAMRNHFGTAPGT